MAPLLVVQALRAAQATHPLTVLCALLFLDGALLSCFTTVLLLHFGTRLPAWELACLGGLSSALGSMLQFRVLARALRSNFAWVRRLAPARARVEAAVAAHPAFSFATILLARATPVPDGPVKLVAAWTGYSTLAYGSAVFLGSVPYYFALGRLGGVARLPFPALLAVVAGASAGIALLGLLVGRVRAAISSPGEAPRR